MSHLFVRAFRLRYPRALQFVASLPANRSETGWTIESFRRSDPAAGPDTWLVVATKDDLIVFGSGLDEGTATLRAFTSVLHKTPRVVRCRPRLARLAC